MSECHENTCAREEQDCHSKGGDADECGFAEELLCLAKSAKHELLKEKMKKVLEARIGKKLDKIAEVAVDAVINCMQHKLAAKQACDQYKENVFAALKG